MNNNINRTVKYEIQYLTIGRIISYTFVGIFLTELVIIPLGYFNHGTLWTPEGFIGFLAASFIGPSILFRLRKYQTIALKMEGELIAAEQNLYKTSKLASLGAMAKGMAHEINNPLSLIKVTLERQLKFFKTHHFTQSTDFPDPSRPQIDQENIQLQLQKSLRSLLRITDIIGSLKRIADSNEETPFSEVPVEKIVNGVLILFQRKFYKMKISLESNNIPEVSIYCHGSQIQFILHALLDNAKDAVKALPEGSRLIVLEFTVDDQYVTFRMTNDGPPLSKETLEHLMTPFYSTKEPGKGIGLDLSISHSYARANHCNFYCDETSLKPSFVLSVPRKSNENLQKAI